MLAVTHPSPDALSLTDEPMPVPDSVQIRVSVRAAGLNRADLLQRAGKYAAPAGWPSNIPGLEYAGEVTMVGAAVTRWRVGDRVMGLVGGGAHAEVVVVHEFEAMPMPAGMTFTDAAAIPEAFLTAWDALVFRARAGTGDRVLMHAIGSGVGTAAVQLARELDIVMIGTSRTQEKLDRCRALGLAHGVMMDGNWYTQVAGEVQAVIDTLGAAVLEANLRLLAPRGRLVLLGTMTGRIASEFDLGRVLQGRLEIIGTAMRVRDLAERISLVERFTRDVLPMFAGHRLQPIVDQVVPMHEIARAHALLEGNGTFGKVILRW